LDINATGIDCLTDSITDYLQDCLLEILQGISMCCTAAIRFAWRAAQNQAKRFQLKITMSPVLRRCMVVMGVIAVPDPFYVALLGEIGTAA